jgi:hypothetical protein
MDVASAIIDNILNIVLVIVHGLGSSTATLGRGHIAR